MPILCRQARSCSLLPDLGTQQRRSVTVNEPESHDLPPDDDAHDTGLVVLTLLAVLAGALTGLIGGLFRIVLTGAESWRTTVLEWTRDAPAIRWLVPVVLAATAIAIARLITRWVPEAAGSGVQRVEAAARDEIALIARLRILPAKFIGGVLAIGGGLALGREGPSVHMGAVIGNRLAAAGGLSTRDIRTMTSALGGAGLAVAFSAPLAGAIFVFEEVTRAFRTKLVLATIAGTVAAMAVAQVLVGTDPIFTVGAIAPQSTWILLGALGVYYNRLIIVMIDAFDAVRGLSPEIKAAIIGGLVGLLGILAPSYVGSGDGLNQEVLLGGLPILTLVLILIVRGFLGPLSYSIGTPGGIFAPLLLLGAAVGALLANLLNAVLPTGDLSPTAFAVVGMSTFFAAVVRAPITAVILIIEMTATTSLIVPMILAAGAAVITATLLKGEPIYDTLRHRIPATP